jgi:hypothetical protein
MKNITETWTPWMSTADAYTLIENVLRKPEYLRKIKAADLGQRLNLTYRDRERLGVWTIAPVDLTPEQLDQRRKERRRAKDRERKQRRRRKAGAKSRIVYLSTSLSRLKPWVKLGISRRTWERRRARDATAVASPSASKLLVKQAS